MKSRTFGSVWDAIEERPESAANMRIRIELMVEIERYVRTGKFSQVEAARKLGITQPRLNDLLRGRIDKFSVDALVNMLGKVGIEVSVRVRKAA